jgi:hypothetical protein
LQNPVIVSVETFIEHFIEEMNLSKLGGKLKFEIHCIVRGLWVAICYGLQYGLVHCELWNVKNFRTLNLLAEGRKSIERTTIKLIKPE